VLNKVDLLDGVDEAEGTHIAGRLPQEVANQLAKYQVAHDGAGSTKS
jgi:hypothetical protein